MLRDEFLYDGPVMVSTGQQVRVMALGNVEAVGLGNPAEEAQQSKRKNIYNNGRSQSKSS
jgi:hypothetical protein